MNAQTFLLEKVHFLQEQLDQLKEKGPASDDRDVKFLRQQVEEARRALFQREERLRQLEEQNQAIIANWAKREAEIHELWKRFALSDADRRQALTRSSNDLQTRELETTRKEAWILQQNSTLRSSTLALGRILEEQPQRDKRNRYVFEELDYRLLVQNQRKIRDAIGETTSNQREHTRKRHRIDEENS